MKKILLGLGAVSALAIAAPAAAQYQNRNFNYQSQAYAGANFEARLERLEARLRTAVDRGTISRDEGWNLRRQLDALDDLHDRYARDGLSQWEQQDLQQRLRTFRRDMRLAGGN
ncbi:MAG TPA: hypothetical protein VGX37_06410, partial [Allosphingosinicella sp.]|nr:hypothetical protein [Allosphingosinicella sp.]